MIVDSIVICIYCLLIHFLFLTVNSLLRTIRLKQYRLTLGFREILFLIIIMFLVDFSILMLNSIILYYFGKLEYLNLYLYNSAVTLIVTMGFREKDVVE